jgi:hypothetical protein
MTRVASETISDGVELLPVEAGWIVRVTEGGVTHETSFKVERAARSYAAGQTIRVSKKPPADE